MEESQMFVVNALIEAGADVNAADAEGRTPIHFAAVYGDAPLMELLLKNGADVNACDSKGQSPLVYAVSGVNILFEEMRPRNVIELLGRLAENTWERLAMSLRLGCSQGEETITDINLLEILRAALPDILVVKTSKADEAVKGIDWEMWIGSNSAGWWRYAVQAKKVNSPASRYDKLRHKIGSKYQFEILDKYAKANNSIPLYCFYNFVDLSSLHKYWRCGQSFQQEQLGCTIAPLDSIRKGFMPRGPKTFDWIHTQGQTIPWRCLACPHYANTTRRNPLDVNLNVRPWNQLPPFLLETSNQSDTDVLNQADYYRLDGSYPRYIIVINTDSIEIQGNIPCDLAYSE